MAEFRTVVYNPPSSGFPFLAVILPPDGGEGSAMPFNTFEEAQAYIEEVSVKLDKAIKEDKGA